jgi:hypothetical protein
VFRSVTIDFVRSALRRWQIWLPASLIALAQSLIWSRVEQNANEAIDRWAWPLAPRVASVLFDVLSLATPVWIATGVVLALGAFAYGDVRSYSLLPAPPDDAPKGWLDARIDAERNIAGFSKTLLETVALTKRHNKRISGQAEKARRSGANAAKQQKAANSAAKDLHSYARALRTSIEKLRRESEWPSDFSFFLRHANGSVPEVDTRAFRLIVDELISGATSNRDSVRQAQGAYKTLRGQNLTSALNHGLEDAQSALDELTEILGQFRKALRGLAAML